MSTSPRQTMVVRRRGYKIRQPFIQFASLQSSGGIVLIAATVLALILANSDLADSYHHLWETPIAVTIGSWALDMHLSHWINDALMAIFFFVVGLEIKREIMVGELSTLRKAVLPIAAAAGGMIVPALLYGAFNAGSPDAHGWGIPMATDIAFALGILTLVGPRIPLALKVFLAALAIIDDIGAVLVIAIFYTSEVHLAALAVAGLIAAVMVFLNYMDVRNPYVYLLFAVPLWLAVHDSGLHATIAGVIAAFTMPASSLIDSALFVKKSRKLLDDFEELGTCEDVKLCSEEQHGVIQALNRYTEYFESPLQRLEHNHHLFVTFLIVPVFALANAGVALSLSVDLLTHGVTVGIFMGLVLGKQVGILLFSWLAVRLRWAALPEGVSWFQIYAVGWLAGIGFTMSLFITGLAFTDPGQIQMAKVGILGASLVAGLVGFALLKLSTRHRAQL